MTSQPTKKKISDPNPTPPVVLKWSELERSSKLSFGEDARDFVDSCVEAHIKRKLDSNLRPRPLTGKSVRAHLAKLETSVQKLAELLTPSEDIEEVQLVKMTCASIYLDVAVRQPVRDAAVILVAYEFSRRSPGCNPQAFDNLRGQLPILQSAIEAAMKLCPTAKIPPNKGGAIENELLVRELAEAFKVSGGKPGASWNDVKSQRDGPFVRFCCAINSVLPSYAKIAATDAGVGSLIARLDGLRENTPTRPKGR